MLTRLISRWRQVRRSMIYTVFVEMDQMYVFQVTALTVFSQTVQPSTLVLPRKKTRGPVASIAKYVVVEMTPPLFPACTATQCTSVTDRRIDRQMDTDIVA